MPDYDAETILALARQDVVLAGGLFSALADVLPQESLLDIAAALPLCGAPHVAVRVLTKLLQRFPQPAGNALLLGVLESATTEVMQLVPHLPAALHPRALACISQMRIERRRWSILSALLPVLADGLLPSARSIALGLRSPLFRAAAVGDIAVRAPPADRARAIDELVASLKQFFALEHPPDFADFGDAIALRIGPWAKEMSPQQGQELMVLFDQKMTHPAWRLAGLAGLAATLHDEQRTELVQRLLRELQPLSLDYYALLDIHVLKQIGPLLPDVPDPLIREILENIKAKPDTLEEWRSRLAEVATALPPRARPEWLAAPAPYAPIPGLEEALERANDAVIQALPPLETLSSDEKLQLARAIATGLERARIGPPGFALHEVNRSAFANVPRMVNEALAPPRYFNTRVVTAADRTPVPVAEPLLQSKDRYVIAVDVGAFSSPGKADVPIPMELLRPFFAKNEELELDVCAHSFDAVVEPPSQKLCLREIGASAPVYFSLGLERSGRVAIDVDLIFSGHALQSRRIVAQVVAQPGDALPLPSQPAQDSYLTALRTGLQDGHGLDVLKDRPSRLTIITRRDLDAEYVGLSFYDKRGAELGSSVTRLTSHSLGRLIGVVRQRLAETMDKYRGHIGGDEQRLDQMLGKLAEIGASFYRELMPDERGYRDLDWGTTIEVTRLSAQLSAPWEVLYERKFGGYHDNVRYCREFRQHGPRATDCPHRDDETVVCPRGFWGFRYVIEQVPGRIVAGRLPDFDPLTLQIDNGVPVRVHAILGDGFDQQKRHLDDLRALFSLGKLDIIELRGIAAVQAALRDSVHPGDIVYFYGHGGSDGLPYLDVGANAKLREGDLDAWGIRLSRHPLFVLSACDSAAYSPDDFENIVECFCEKMTAGGVIGTQCTLLSLFGDEFMLRFFREFLSKDTVGKALFDTRWDLMDKDLDPRGLTFSLFSAADLRLGSGLGRLRERNE